MINKNEIRGKLPHGSLTKIALRARVSKATVTRFLKDSIKSSPSIEKAALEVAIEYQEGISKLSKRLAKVTQ